MRRIAILVVSISAIQFGFSWTAAAVAREHVPVFDRGAEIAAGRSSPTTAAVDMASVRSDVDRLNSTRNIFFMLTFLCDTVLYFIAFCVFLCAIFICRGAIFALLSQLRRGKSRRLSIAVVESRLEQHNGRMLGLCIWNMFALLLLIITYLVMLIGVSSVRTEAQCPGRFEAGPCSRRDPTRCANCFASSPHFFLQLPKRANLE
jgi:hypothetical protein